MSGADSCITILARDPNWLYVYWNIPEEKNMAFLAELGEELWKRSIPALKVSNITRNESFFVRINEFSDNWYVNVMDSNNLYTVEIGRKVSENYFIGISSSNSVITPSNYVSPDNTACFVNYVDLKSGSIEIQAGKVCDSTIYDRAAEGVTGLFGESSAAPYGTSLQELPGISSESFVKG